MTNSIPQARATDQAMCAGPPDFIVVGSSSVTINDLMAARIGDPTTHGGVIAAGSSNVEIGGPPAGVALGNPEMGEKACRLAAKTRAPKAPSIAPFFTPLQQSWGNCGPESARQIINTVHGTEITQEELLSQALITGVSQFGKWYEIGGVTQGSAEHPQSGFVRLLEENGVPATEVLPTSQNLIQAIGER
jgi:PAAR motif